MNQLFFFFLVQKALKLIGSSDNLGVILTSAKTHKFENFDDINTNELKLQPIIDQTGICYYKMGKVIAQYLKLITKNEFVINNLQDNIQQMLNRLEVSEDEEDVSYDIGSLFTNITITETIDFICNEICIQPICKCSIFKNVLSSLLNVHLA